MELAVASAVLEYLISVVPLCPCAMMMMIPWDSHRQMSSCPMQESPSETTTSENYATSVKLTAAPMPMNCAAPAGHNAAPADVLHAAFHDRKNCDFEMTFFHLEMSEGLREIPLHRPSRAQKCSESKTSSPTLPMRHLAAVAVTPLVPGSGSRPESARHGTRHLPGQARRGEHAGDGRVNRRGDPSLGQAPERSL